MLSVVRKYYSINESEICKYCILNINALLMLIISTTHVNAFF